MKICFINKLKYDKNSRLVYIVISCFVIAIILIVINFFLVNKAADDVRKNIVDYFVLENINDINGYNLEYDLTVYGNKTINRYTLEEQYKKLENGLFYFKFITTDKDNNSFKYEITNNSINIYSENQTSNYSLENYEANLTNIYSMYTFLNIYYQMKNNECKCSDYVYYDEYDEFIIYGIIFEKNIDENLNVVEYDKINDENGLKIKKLELKLSKESMLPIMYMGYDKDENTLFEITYNSVKFD